MISKSEVTIYVGRRVHLIVRSKCQQIQINASKLFTISLTKRSSHHRSSFSFDTAHRPVTSLNYAVIVMLLASLLNSECFLWLQCTKF